MGNYQSMKIMQFVVIALILAGEGAGLWAQAQRTAPHHIMVRHPGVAGNKPQPYTLLQMQDQHGYPREYSMVVDSVICTEHLCKVAKVTMAWDALGRYQSYALAADSVLEKANTTDTKSSSKNQAWAPFTPDDHAKLDRILRDSESILRKQRLSDLTGFRDKSKLDGITGATPKTIRDSVVQGAALSSYHLWHWANGEVSAAARELTHQSCSEEMLRHFLFSDKSHYVLFALEHLQRHKLFTPSLVKAVIDVCSSGDQDRIDRGLAYLRAALPDDDAFYDKLGALFRKSGDQGRIHLLGVLDAEKTISGAQLDILSSGLKNTDTYYELHLFLNLVEKHKHVSQQILTQVSRFLESENFFIARRAYWYLEKQTLNGALAQRVDAFRKNSAKENRMLR